MSGQVATYLGQKVTVGLHWRLADAPTGSRLYKFGDAGLGFVSLGSQLAETTSADATGTMALSWLAGQLIKDQDGIAAVVLPLEDGRHLGVHIEHGLPLVEAERLFGDAQTAVEWAIQSKRSSFADTIFVASDFVEIARAVDAGVAPQILPEFDTLAEEVLAAAPKVEPYKVIGTRQLALGGVGLASVAALLIFLPAVIGYFTDSSSEMDLPPVIPTVDLAIDMPSFAQSCVIALRGEWPGVPGWQVARTGCALPGAPRPFGDMNEAVAWKEYTRKPSYQQIPASGITSARMAAYMFQEWPFEEQVIEGQILAARSIELEYSVFEPVGTAVPDFRTRLENAFVSVLSEHLPKTLSPAADPAQPTLPTYATLSLNTSMADAFEKALFMPATDVLAIEENGETTKITLDDRRARLTVDEVKLADYVTLEEEPNE